MEKKLFHFKQNRELYLVIMSFIKLPQTWPISFQYTSIVPNWTELAQYLFNELRELNFMSFMSQLFLRYFSLLQIRFSIKMEEGTQISRVIEKAFWYENSVEKKLTIKELWQCEKNMYLHCALMESMFEWH